MAKAITIQQPYAQLIVLGHKQYETRSWRTHFRGELLIHAASRGYTQAVEKALTQFAGSIADAYAMHTGAIIGKVKVTDCIPVEKLLAHLSDFERSCGYWQKGNYAWKLEEPEMFSTPITLVKGTQGLWNYTHIY